MPPFASLSPADLENLVAYLSVAAAGADGAAGCASRPPTWTSWTFDRLDEHRRPQDDCSGRAERSSIRPSARPSSSTAKDDALFIDNHPLAGADGVYVGGDLPARRRREGAAMVSSERAGSRDRRRHRQPDALRDPGRRRPVVLRQLQPVGSREQGAHQPDGAASSRRLVSRRRRCTTARNSATMSTACGRARPSCTWRLTARAMSSVGVRINKVFYFKGAVHLARFTRRALSPSEFLRIPAKP